MSKCAWKFSGQADVTRLFTLRGCELFSGTRNARTLPNKGLQAKFCIQTSSFYFIASFYVHSWQSTTKHVVKYRVNRLVLE